MVLNNVDRVVEKESTQDTVRSYQLLFAKYIYEAGTEGYLQKPFRQDHQAILGDQEIERAELPVIESFEADCQQYQIVYRSALYSTGRVNKLRLLEEQQKLSLGEPVVKQLVKVVRQEFYHACDVYREIYATDLRDDGQLNEAVLEREQDRWGLGPSIVQAIASTEQSTFTTDQIEYCRVAAQAIHQTGHLDAEQLRSLQLQFSFGNSLVEHLNYDVQAEFQAHLETYHQQFLDMLRHNGTIGQAEQSRLQDLRQSLGNIHQSLLAEFEATAIATHEQNVVAYADEARQVIQQFTTGNVSEPTPEEQESLAALSHWYNLSPAIAAQIERVVRAELLEEQGVEPTAQVNNTTSEVLEQSSSMETSPSLMEVADPLVTVPSIDAVEAVEELEEQADVEATQAEYSQQLEEFQGDPISEADSGPVTSSQSSESAEMEALETPTLNTEADTTLPTSSHQDVEPEAVAVNQMMATQEAGVSAAQGEVTGGDEATHSGATPIDSQLEGANQSYDDPPEMPPAIVSEVMTEDIPESDAHDMSEVAHEMIASTDEMAEDATHEEGTHEIAEDATHETAKLAHAITESTLETEISDISDVSTQANTPSSDVLPEKNKTVLPFNSSQTTPIAPSNSKRVLAVGASIVAGVVLLGGAIAMLRGPGNEQPVPSVDLQSNTVEIAQSGQNTVVTETASANGEATESSTPAAITPETMETFTEVQQLIQDRQVVSGLKLLATVPLTETTEFEVDGILRQVFQQAEAYYQEGLYAEATTVTNTMSQLFPQQAISEKAMIASKEWQDRWHANLATLKVAEDALEKQEYDSAIAEAQKVSHPGLQIQVATIIDKAIQAKQEQAALAEQARQNRVPPQSGSPAPRATVAPRRSAPAPAPAPRTAPRATPQPAPQPAASSQSPGYYSPDPL